MFHNIVVPVDLAHVASLEKALVVSADLARHYGAKVTYVSVASSAPGAVAHTPQEFAEKLARFAAAQAELRGIEAGSHPEISHDPAIDLDRTLLRASETLEADLIVMASHVPGLADYLWPSNGGTVAGHSRATVMVVRS
ncbi:MAG: universal stress protein [Rhodobacteraceae bacterium]|nr:MAG: universal stress protein [Paracoccaceae bacterium]